MHISELYRGQPVVFHSERDGALEPLHAVIAHVDHANTEDNSRPRLHLAVLLPNGQWTRRMAVPMVDDEQKDGRWEELK